MEKEVLQKIRDDYIKNKEKQDEYINNEKRIKELENNDLVKEYLELIEKRNDYMNLKITEEDLMYKSFRKYMKDIKNTNEIYVYLGTFKNSNEFDVVHGYNQERLTRTSPNAKYSIYMNIEKEEYTEVPIESRDEFEKSHQIIFTSGYFHQRKYYELQQLFIKCCIEDSQEEAVNKILKLK